MLQTRRVERHHLLKQLLRDDPLRTDEDLARSLGVSVPTIRLDRLYLGIPEVRLRAEGLARQAVVGLRALEGQEIVGDLIDLAIGQHAVSVLDTTPDMTFRRSGVVRSQHLFAQADSLALSVVDGDWVLTGLANSKFKRPVFAGERLVARAEVIRRRQSRYVVLVITQVGSAVVFRGKFLVVDLGGRQGGIERADRS